MNARQKAKLYKKKYNELYKACMLHVAAENIEREMRQRSIIDIRTEQRFSPDMVPPEKYESNVIEAMLRHLALSTEFKQSVAVEKYIDEITGEIVYRAYLQTIRPKLEE